MTNKQDPKKTSRVKILHAERNREAANIILKDPLRYGGGDSLMVRWAHMVIYGYVPIEKNWRIVA